MGKLGQHIAAGILPAAVYRKGIYMIYHYAAYENAKNILESQKLYLGSSTSMEDKIDRFYGNLYATVHLLTSNHRHYQDIRENLTTDEILKINEESLNLPLYSASFCKRQDNEYLWKNYADNKKGVALGFDEELLQKNIDETLRYYYKDIDGDKTYCPEPPKVLPLRTVTYSSSDAKEFMDKVADDLYNRFFTNLVKDKKVDYKFFWKLILCLAGGVIKGTDYRKEEEIRLIFQNIYDEKYMADYPITMIQKYEYEEGMNRLGLMTLFTNEPKERFELDLQSQPNSPKVIKQIVLGEDFPEENKEEVRKLAATNGLEIVR